MDYTDILINIIDKVQAIYEWFVRVFGEVAGWFERFKNFILDLVSIIKAQFTGKHNLEAILENYLETEQIFI